ncbi:hypothetical protein NIES2119_08355 [[Phormidium ambiguum] IAM M-71]|uniref:Uncharacterized protein n=1 Tax=[Phormidium ambiguum] IAM M-71 TaxID=454136 RepID=A0A1U7IPE2_9CYAN|nr:hypothetical protein [Phormidium ambiguum]OKH39130.1 hypothetical protein NIES2119_08355 [Phormidium ambiguum IAM M-71]
MKSIFPIYRKGRNLLISALLISSSVLVATVANTPTATAQYSPRYPVYPNPGSPVYPRPGIQSLNGAWRVNWQVNGYSMSGRLYMQGNQGVLRLRVRDGYGNTQRIEETMFLVPRENGFALRGSNPVFRGTNIPVPNYRPDNFRVRQTPDGWAIRTCDSSGICAPASMQYMGSEMFND